MPPCSRFIATARLKGENIFDALVKLMGKPLIDTSPFKPVSNYAHQQNSRYL